MVIGSPASPAKARVRFLIPVWGRRYVERAEAFAIPSYLAPGNLPALAEAFALEVVFLTRQSDEASIRQGWAFAALSRLYPVRFLYIDDLVVDDCYGVVLTYAYLRGITDVGEAMVDVHFVFMNADFVLADGSLRYLIPMLRAGRRAIVAPSLRATLETVGPELDRLTDPAEAVLACPPRRLVGLALRHLHWSVRAKSTSQDVFHTHYPNQFYWPVDQGTLLARYFLMALLCIRPERPVYDVGAFCDYAFVPEMCPSAEADIAADSDGFFALELQERDSERPWLRVGPLPRRRLVDYLSEWTTREHRAFAERDVVFHAGEIAPGIEAAKAAANLFIGSIKSELTPVPKPHRDHPYWTASLAIYRRLRAEERGAEPPAEAARPRSPAAPAKRLLKRAYRAVTGIPPLLSPFHYAWLDYRTAGPLAAALAEGARGRVLYVAETPNRFDGLFLGRRLASARLSTTAFAENAAVTNRPVGLLFVYLTPRSFPLVEGIARRAANLLADDGEALVFIDNSGPTAVRHDQAFHLLSALDRLAGIIPDRERCIVAGGRMKFVATEAIHAAIDTYRRGGRGALFAAAPLLIGGYALAVGCNLVQGWLLGGRGSAVNEVSSMFVRLSKHELAAAAGL